MKKMSGHTTNAGSPGDDLSAGYFMPIGKVRVENTDSNVVKSVDGEYTTGGVVGGLHSKKDHGGIKAGRKGK